MLRQDPSSLSPDLNGANAHASTQGGVSGSVDIQRELNHLEEMILDSPRIPLTRRTLIDEEQILDQLDLVRLSLPTSFRDAEEIVRHKEEIVLEAEQYAQQIIESAERRAAQMLDEVGIIRQAEQEARQIWQRTQQECETLREQTIAEIEQMQRQAQQELDDVRRRTLVECEQVQNGADEYADQVLQDMEQQLSDMIRIIRNGRQQLQPETPTPRREPNSGSNAAGSRSAPPATPKKNL